MVLHSPYDAACIKINGVFLKFENILILCNFILRVYHRHFNIKKVILLLLSFIDFDTRKYNIYKYFFL